MRRQKKIISALLFLVFGFFFKNSLAQETPNLLVITLDTTRADHIGCYGYDKAETPNIDTLGKSGTIFKTAISQIPLTIASHSVIFTSTYPQFNNVRDNGTDKLDSSAVTLAEVMKDQGYATAAFVSTYVLNAKFGLNQGFDTYDDHVNKNSKKTIIKYMEGEKKADETTNAAVTWLKANQGKKFFLWVHYYDPHDVYNPPSPYKEKFKDNLYDGEIAFADSQIGILLNSLKELGVSDNTLIVFASDHGEGLGDHGESGHAVFVYDSTQRVPLIFHFPGTVPQGKIVEGQVRLIDIMPTVLDIFKIKKPKDIQGTSLTPMIQGGKKTLGLIAYSESLYAHFHFNWSKLQAYRTETWKYIRSTEPELYNIKDDPRELTNLASKRRDVVKDLDKKLENFLEKTSSLKSKETKREIDKETKEKLSSLGYIQGDSHVTEPVPIQMIQIMEKVNISDRMANAGMVDQAIQSFKEVLEADPNNMEANLHLGQCYREQKNYDEAIKYFQKAAASKANEAEAHDGLGNTYKSMGRVEQAFNEFNIALELDPGNPIITTNIGWYYQQKMNFNKAMEWYKKALKLDPDTATAHANMGICYRVKGNMDQALQEIETAIRLDPELAFAWGELCALKALEGKMDEAVSNCKKAIEVDPEGIDGYNNLGVCYERMGQYDKALENYLEAQKHAPWDLLVTLNVGNAYNNVHQPEKAIEYYKKVLEMDPGNLKASENLKRLSQK